MKWLKHIPLTAVAAVLCTMQAQAGVVISGTRVVFPGNENEVTVQLTNDAKRPALVQAWLDDGDRHASPETVDVPFTLTPAMFRMEPGNGQTLRLIHTGEPLPADRESLFWLNVLDIPPQADETDARNRIQLAVRSRIKVMYRPAALQGNAGDAPKQLVWRVVRTDNGQPALEAVNPTPFVVNFGNVRLKSQGGKYEAGAGYVLPRASARFPLQNFTGTPGANATVEFGGINDWGATKDLELPLSPAR
ncbi:fimbrial biogenesis chaperone [Burkholderia anthina]|uniref:fimbrial biogenesis chaperone n=1 Tax=Burkholderia anthina TaxID=179879 RepID=UPI0015891BAB|nr:fimbria/pilus periplasmic chaperone [Burkholderia anthina]